MPEQYLPTDFEKAIEEAAGAFLQAVKDNWTPEAHGTHSRFSGYFEDEGAM